VKFALYVEGYTERALSSFLKRWLDPRLSRGVGIDPVRFSGSGDYRKSFAKMSALVTMMHNAGVPIVAGTDGSGLELVRELELYVAAGFTPEEALATATIAPARLLIVDKK